MKLKRILPAVMTCLALCMFSMSQAVLASFAARIAASFGHGAGWSGFLFAAGCIFYIVVSPFAGRLVSAVGRHIAVSLALVFCAVPAFCIPFAERFWLVCLALAVLGGASVFVLLTGIEAVSVLTGRIYAECIPLCAAVLGFGALCGAGSSCLLTCFGHGWRRAYFILGIILAVAAVLHAVIPFPKLPPFRLDYWQSERRSTLRVQRMYRYSFAIFLYAGVEVVAVGWIAAYMTNTLGYTPLIASVAIALVWLGVAIGRFMYARAADRTPPRQCAAILSLVLFCSLILLTAVPDGRLFWLAVCVMGAGLSVLGPLFYAAGVDANDGGGATLSVLVLWDCAGKAVVSLLAGAFGSWISMRSVMILAMVLLLGDLMMIGRVIPRKCLTFTYTDGEPELPEMIQPQHTEEMIVQDEFADLGEITELDEFDDFPEFAELRRIAGMEQYDDGPRYMTADEFVDLAEFDDLEAPMDTYNDNYELADDFVISENDTLFIEDTAEEAGALAADIPAVSMEENMAEVEADPAVDSYTEDVVVEVGVDLEEYEEEAVEITEEAPLMAEPAEMDEPAQPDSPV